MYDARSAANTHGQHLGMFGLDDVVDDDFDEIGRNQFQRRGEPGADKSHRSQHSEWLEIRQYAQKRVHDDSPIRDRSDDTGGFFLPVLLKLFHLRQRGEIAHAIENNLPMR